MLQGNARRLWQGIKSITNYRRDVNRAVVQGSFLPNFDSLPPTPQRHPPKGPLRLDGTKLLGTRASSQGSQACDSHHKAAVQSVQTPLMSTPHRKHPTHLVTVFSTLLTSKKKTKNTHTVTFFGLQLPFSGDQACQTAKLADLGAGRAVTQRQLHPGIPHRQT